MPKKPSEIVAERDKEKRIEDETIILKKSHSLTNGDKGDPKLTGEVLHWLVIENIAQGALLRSLVESQGVYQLKSECAGLHEQKRWAVKMFGQQYNLPITTAIIVMGLLIYSAMKAQGWL